MQDATARTLSRIHTTLYRLTSGVVGKRLVNNDMLLLETTGRHSGDHHTVPLLYLRDDPDLVVFASWGGRDLHPDWYLNLVADAKVVIEVPGMRAAATARVAEGDERDRWFARAQAAYHGYTEYQSKTDRRIPVVILTPTADP